MREKKNISIITALIIAMVLITSCAKPAEDSSSEGVDMTYETKTETVITTTTEPPEPPLVLLEAAKEQIAINEDYAGWIKIDGGIVDEPVVQLPDDAENGNLFYLDHSFKTKGKAQSGTIFADFRSVLNTRKQSDNIILYGHDQRDQSRFGRIKQFRWNTTLAKTHPLVTFNTAYEERTYKIYSMFIVVVDPQSKADKAGEEFPYHNFINFKDEKDFDGFIDKATRGGLFTTGVDAKYGDKFLTLSTCTSESVNGYESRLVLLARELRDGESTEVDTSLYKVNESPQKLNLYNKKE